MEGRKAASSSSPEENHCSKYSELFLILLGFWFVGAVGCHRSFCRAAGACGMFSQQLLLPSRRGRCNFGVCKEAAELLLRRPSGA